jgi:hypothetical protein
VLHVPAADADANLGDRSYLVLAKPNVIMNDVRLSPVTGLEIAPALWCRVTTSSSDTENGKDRTLYQGTTLAALFHSGAKRGCVRLLICVTIGGNPWGLGSGRL